MHLSETLNKDGVVQIHSLLCGEGLELLRKGIAANLERPSPMHRRMENPDEGYFFSDFNNWRRLELIHSVAHDPKLVNLVCELTQSTHCWLFHDHVLVKEGQAKATPWHQDRPYYIFKGDKNVSIWITADDVPRNSSLLFLRGSHLDNNLYLPKSFDNDAIIAQKQGLEQLDETTFSPKDVLDFELKAGDALLFFHRTIHASRTHNHIDKRRALSIRYLCDGASLTEQYVNATPPFDRMGVTVSENGPIPENFFPKLR